MAAPKHDPELFDELMRAELLRQPVSRYAIATLVTGLLGGLIAPVFAAVAVVRIRKHRQHDWILVICGLVAFAGWMGIIGYKIGTGTAWWQQPREERLPAGTAHGLDLAAGECFWSPVASGADDVLRAPCTTPHTAEAFEVLPLGEGPMPNIVEVYQRTLVRCEADARQIPVARVQVVTPTSVSWNEGKHRAVCYYRFASEMTEPAR